MEDIEVTTFSVHPSLVLGSLGGISSRTLRDLGEDRGNSTIKVEAHMDKELGNLVTARINGGEMETGTIFRGRAEHMCRGQCLLAQEESQLAKTKLLMKEQLSLQQQ
jgi:hypothetical protein